MDPTESDFNSGPLADFGTTVSRTPVTITNNNVTGEKIRTEGASANITVVIINPNIIYDLERSGENKNTEVFMFTDKDQTINKEDKITWQGIDLRVNNVSSRFFNGNEMFKRVGMFLI